MNAIFKQSSPKLRRARFKDGCTVHAMERKMPSIAKTITGDATEIAAGVERDGSRLAGYALVGWSQDGTTFSAINVMESPIQFGAVPQFVASKLQNTVDNWDGE